MKQKARAVPLLLTAILTGLLLYGCKPGHEMNLYVSPSGNDENPGTKDKPFKHIQKAVNSAKPGTVILARQGDYQEQILIKKSGQKGAPIVLKNYPGEKAVINGKGVPVSSDNQGLISLQNSSYVTIEGLEIKDYQTNKEDLVPAGIFISGSGKGIRLVNNHLYHIETHHKNGNAHGIAVYGSKAPEAFEDIVISGNTLENMKLGESEALVLNGNVKDFKITNNTVRNMNNIGIDLIGYEGTAPDERYDQARNGMVSGNTVSGISSYGNPAYGNDYSAGGIYVDGGKNITIEKNNVFQNDIGIEAASEHAGKTTSGIIIQKNTIYENSSAGIAIGGYDEKRGSTADSVITGNILYKNDARQQEAGQILLQYHAWHNKIENNTLVAGESNLMISSPFKGNDENIINNNVYYLDKGEQSARWIWEDVDITGFSVYRERSGKDAGSVFKKEELRGIK
ncbi:DUF1565 domain-containing protein [Metabacillus sp. GX 13764]|uniref:right-handed parallel beta-helix repeat-containing protein n=1 Tax=Metabacillus kandeliae TaxID=2900151 RepID=UPI001E539284|nr:right-handed parallel beta-helix repeat-containing protein [Metabacillus kandeliae]MCD7034214.1 DUF1565 domain-containing protein [Metabacillus kandeliae]